MKFKLLSTIAHPLKSAHRGLYVTKKLASTGALPLEVDLKTGAVFRTTSSPKLTAFSFISFVSCFYLIHSVSTLLVMFVDSRYLHLEHFSVHAAWIGVALIACHVRFNYFGENMDLFLYIYNRIHQPRKTHLQQEFQLTRQALWLGIVPASILMVAILAWPLTAVDPRRLMHVYFWYDMAGNIPSTGTDWAVYAASSAVGLVVVLGLYPCYMLIYMQYRMIEHLNEGLQEVVREISKRSWAHDAAALEQYWIRLLRTQQLLIRRCNALGSNAIFCMKQLFLVGTIFGCYAFIAYFSDNVITTLTNLSIGGHCAFFYAINYERGYLVAALMEDAKRQVLKRCRASPSLVQRQIRSIYVEGVRVGGFNSLERSSTLVFLEFATTKVAGMLLTLG